MPHPLDGAFARVDRASSHLEELKSLIEVFRLEGENEFFRNRDPNPATAVYGFSMTSVERNIVSPAIPVPVGFPIVVGDVVHNLRAALDYLVFELAKRDSHGVAQDHTQFVIETRVEPNDKRTFATRNKRFLNGLSIPHIAALEGMQPQNGGAWLKTLSDISNQDKHREFIATGGRWEGSLTQVQGPSGSFDGRPGKVFRGIGKNGADVYMEGKYTLDIQFPDGLSTVETLEMLRVKVRDTLEFFKPEL